MLLLISLAHAHAHTLTMLDTWNLQGIWKSHGALLSSRLQGSAGARSSMPCGLAGGNVRARPTCGGHVRSSRGDRGLAADEAEGSSSHCTQHTGGCLLGCSYPSHILLCSTQQLDFTQGFSLSKEQSHSGHSRCRAMPLEEAGHHAARLPFGRESCLGKTCVRAAPFDS